MSGPKTATLVVDPVSVMLAAAGLRAAHAVQEGYAEAARQREAHAQQRAAIQARQQQAELAGQQAMQAAQLEAQAETAQLLLIAQRLGLAQQVQTACPQPPLQADEANEADSVAQMHYARALQAWNEQVRALLQFETARRHDEVASAAAGDELALPAEDQSALAGAASQESQPDARQTVEDCKTTAKRLLARLSTLGLECGAAMGGEFQRIPDDIRQLALTLAASQPGERATLLASDLRLRIQRHIEAVGQKLAQQATAFVVEQSLKDLGYQVEPIAETLFVEGGVVHFRRQSWGDYMVRMRINASGSEANFNVIRAVAEANNEATVLDHIAEDRWCSEFPQLMQTLAARGVQMTVTRHLGAGELPVQQVQASKLPVFADDEAQQTTARRQQMNTLRAK